MLFFFPGSFDFTGCNMGSSPWNIFIDEVCSWRDLRNVCSFLSQSS